MRDVIYVVITVAFFAICFGLIQACDRVIGPDDLDELDQPDDLLDGADGAAGADTAELVAGAGR